jgi:hypothetical protein
MRIHLVLQSYGNENEYRRAVFAIWSYFACSTSDEHEVTLFTDNPKFFELFLQGLPIRYITLTKAKIAEMRGSIDFVHRVKIAVIQEAFAISQTPMLYIDSDTFFISDPVPYMRHLSPALAFMHEFEYRFKEMEKFPLPAGATFLRYYKHIMSRTFRLPGGEEVKFSPEQVSWNAGVILLDPSHAAHLDDVLALTDQTYPGTENHGCEQYAFSFVLERHGAVEPCYDMVYHYWPKVKKNIADKFLLEKISAEWSLLNEREKLFAVKEWIKVFPGVFEEDVLMYQNRSILHFNDNEFREGYQNAWKALRKRPFDVHFSRDVFYHVLRSIKLR